MNVVVITRIPRTGSHYEDNWCDTFVGATSDAAKTQAVNSVMVDWFGERVDEGEEDETDDVNVIFDKYVDFWSEEEIWNVEEHSFQ